MLQLTPALLSALPDGLATGGVAFEIMLAAAAEGAERTPPEWIQLTPRGDITTRDGRRVTFDPERLAQTFMQGGVDLPIDFEHETEFTATLGARPARGWIVELSARPEGLFGRVQWLADAVQALAARSYRYISPTLYLDADKRTARALKGAALVVAPALAGLPALASAQSGEFDMKDVLVALGLAETATQTDAVSAIALLKAGDPTLFVPKAQHDQTVAALSAAQARLDGIEEAAATARRTTLVDDAIKAGKLAPAARDQYLALAAAAFDQTKAAIDAMPVLLRAGVDKDADADPDKGATGQLSEQERDIVARLGISEADFLKTRG